MTPLTAQIAEAVEASWAGLQAISLDGPGNPGLIYYTFPEPKIVGFYRRNVHSRGCPSSALTWAAGVGRPVVIGPAPAFTRDAMNIRSRKEGTMRAGPVRPLYISPGASLLET